MIFVEFGNNDFIDYIVVVVDKEGYDICGKLGVKYDIIIVFFGYFF